MKKNIKFESFDAGKAGQGQINLQTGEMEFVHNDTISDSSILPISVSHVYSTILSEGNHTTAFGKGFRLNLNQRLQKVDGDSGDNKYFLFDASNRRYEFRELYYYLNSEGKKEYNKLVNGESIKLTREDISVDYKGKLTYENQTGIHEIFSEKKTDSGLVLKTDLKGFKNAEKIETRQEELIQLEEEVKSLERNIEDLTFSIMDYSKLDDSAYLDLKAKQEDIEIKSYELELKGQENFNGTHSAGYSDGTKFIQKELNGLTADYYKFMYKKNANIGGLFINGNGDNERSIIGAVSNTEVPAYQFTFNSGKSRFTYQNDIGKEIDRLTLLASYANGFTKDEYSDIDHFYDSSGEDAGANDSAKRNKRILRVIQFLQERFNETSEIKSQNVREKSFMLETKNLLDQEILMEMKDSLLARQMEFQRLKKIYDDGEEARARDYYAILKERAKIDILAAENMLDYKRFVLGEYREQIPANYTSDQNGLIYGFNEMGNLISIWDAYENYVSMIYENGDLVGIQDADKKKIVFEYLNGKLSAIVDTMELRTSFSYDGEYLERITYPNGDESFFTYHNGRLHELQPPAGIGIRLEYDEKGRPIKIVSITSTERINADLLEQGGLEIEDRAQIVYNATGTSTYVSDPKTGYRTTYLFNSEGEWVSEYTELDHVMKSITTYDVGHRKCYFTMQQTDFDKNIMEEATMMSHGTNVEWSSNGDITIRNNPSSNGYADWNIDLSSLPLHATDLILSGFAIADSDQTVDRRKTEYCDRFGHEHCETPSPDPQMECRRFELRAEVAYPNRTKIFIASFDWKIKSRQFVAIPVTLDEDDTGEPIMPTGIKIIADYSNNTNECRFMSMSLANGDWVYIDADEDNRKIFECTNRKMSDRTTDGTVVGKHITYSETFYEYDKKGNLLMKRTVVNRNGQPTEYLTKYEYNKQSRPIRITSPTGMVSETVYDDKGNSIKSFSYHKSNPACRFVRENEQNEKGQVTAKYDARGENKTSLRYMEGTNILTGSIGPDGQETAMGLDPYTGELLAITSSVEGETNRTEFVYTKGFLTRLSSGGTAYDYSYEGWGRKAEICIAGTPHVQYTYETDPQNGNEKVIATYANNDQYETITDKFGKILRVNSVSNGIRKPYVSYQYDIDDRLTIMTDHFAGRVIEYTYNEDGSLNTERTDDVSTTADYNIDGNAEKLRFSIQDIGDMIYENRYNEDGTVTEIVLPNGLSEKVEYDSLGRVIGIAHPAYREKINYYQKGRNATNLISSVFHGNDSTRLRYDVNGNVTEIRENGNLTVRYDYDGLGRLVREDNLRLGKSETFEYDTNGNITFKNTYPFSLDDLTLGRNSSYCYADEGNRDRMTQFNGETCAYDELGNPKVYRNKDLVWNNLRDLVQYENVRFGYDGGGLRLSKRSLSTNTKFHWAGERLLAERRTTEYGGPEFDSVYTDENGTEHPCFYLQHDPCNEPCPDHSVFLYASIVDISYLHGADGHTGFTVSRQGGSDVRSYYYRRNIQGDVTHILDSDGNVKAEYVYDAWGNHSIITDEEGIGSLNPIRYRGYYFDDETGLYYLRTRYYDPETGRFVNADSLDVFDETSGDINGLNLYMYCANNPITNCDPTGQSWWDRAKNKAKNFLNSNLGKALVITAIVAAVVIISIATAGIGTIGVAGVISTAMGGTALGTALGGAVAGAIIGASIGAGFSVISQGLMNGFNNIDMGTVAKDTLVGALTGATIGGTAGRVFSAVGKLARISKMSSGLGRGSNLSFILGKTGLVDDKIASNVSNYLGFASIVTGVPTAVKFLVKTTTASDLEIARVLFVDLIGSPAQTFITSFL